MGSILATRKTSAGASNPGEFLLSQFGFSANGSRAANAAAYVAAQNAAAPVRGMIKLPAGTFLMDPVQYDPHVSLQGLGYAATVLDVPGGQYLFNYPSTNLIEPVGRVADIGFVGNGVGAGAFQSNAQAYFECKGLKFKGLTNYALDFKAALIGKIADCWFRETAYGVRNVGAVANVAEFGNADTLANLVTITGCTFQAVLQRSVHWERGSALYITNSDFESCGTNGNNNTGLIKLVDPCPLNEPIALVLEKRYTENNGGIGLDIVMGAGTTKVILRDAGNWDYAGQAKKEAARIRAAGGIGRLTIYVENTDLTGATSSDISATGNVDVEIWRSKIGSHTEANGATYTVLGGSSTSAPITPSENDGTYKFSGVEQQITAVNADQLGFQAGVAGTIAFKAALLDTTGRFSISRGTDSVRNWDIDMSYNTGEQQIQLGAQLTDANGHYLYSLSGKTVGSNIPELLPGNGYVVIVRYDGGTSTNSLTVTVNNSNAFQNGPVLTDGGFAGLINQNTVRIGRIVSQPSKQATLDYLLFANKRLTDAECTELYSTPNANLSFNSSITAYFKFKGNLLDETNNHNGTATTPQFV